MRKELDRPKAIEAAKQRQAKVDSLMSKELPYAFRLAALLTMGGEGRTM